MSNVLGWAVAGGLLAGLAVSASRGRKRREKLRAPQGRVELGEPEIRPGEPHPVDAEVVLHTTGFSEKVGAQVDVTVAAFVVPPAGPVMFGWEYLGTRPDGEDVGAVSFDGSTIYFHPTAEAAQAAVIEELGW